MDWQITVGTPDQLSCTDVADCLVVISEGDAVDPASAGDELPLSLLVAMARIETAIVGVAVIKRPRPGYAASVAKKSGFALPVDLPELGYTAVRKKHHGLGIGSTLVSAVLANYGEKPLYATTSHPAMKKRLAHEKFSRVGKTWAGKHGELTLWLLRYDLPEII